MIRRHVVSAVFRRNFHGYFRSPTGYVFIAVFLLLSAAMAFCLDQFFVNNQANLDVLNQYFPYLLLFFVPAVAMSIWSEERKQGTDELLFTLPARDLELVVGKYLAIVGIYGASLLFALMFLFVLLYLGSPDFGLLLGTYIGYFFLGSALLSVAMLASLLTTSMTVAFILGALFCATPVFLAGAGTFVTSRKGASWVQSLGIDEPFREFTSGVLSLEAVFYFVALTAVMLYLNLILLARRHTQKPELWLHRGVRAVCLLVAGVGLVVLLGRLGWRADVTQERLHSLAPATREVIKRIDPSRSVYIQAYVSPEVPPEYVETRATLIGLLRDIAAMGGSSIQLRIVDAEKRSAESREAEDQYAIKPHGVRTKDEGVERSQNIFLGAAFTCGTDEVVVPFFDKEVPVEYQVTRAIGTVSGLKRRKVGIVATDAKMFGGFDMQTMRSQEEWQVISDLKKQYDVAQVHLDQPLNDKYDCLIVPMPSSLTQPQMDALLAYLRKGNPALLLDDPFPAFNPGLSPDQPKPGPGGRGAMFGQPPSEPKGDLHRFLDGIGIRWPSDSFVGENWNPHPTFKDVYKEIVFVGTGNGNPEAFNTADSITAKLQEVVFIFPGYVQARPDLTTLKFTPLVSTGPQSAHLDRARVMERGGFMGGLEFKRHVYVPGGEGHAIAARVDGTLPPAPHAPGTAEEKPATVKYVFVADLDLISDQFYGIREQGRKDMNFDNIAFVLNAVDSLCGDESYIELRKRRPRLRTLSRIEEQMKADNKKQAEETEKAEDDAKKDLEAAEKKLKDTIDELNKRTDLPIETKLITVKNVEEVENRRLEMKKKEIEDKKESAIEKSATERDQAVKAIRFKIRVLAILLPPIPAALIALFVVFQRASGPRRAA